MFQGGLDWRLKLHWNSSSFQPLSFPSTGYVLLIEVILTTEGIRVPLGLGQSHFELCFIWQLEDYCGRGPTSLFTETTLFPHIKSETAFTCLHRSIQKRYVTSQRHDKRCNNPGSYSGHLNSCCYNLTSFIHNYDLNWSLDEIHFSDYKLTTLAIYQILGRL